MLQLRRHRPLRLCLRHRLHLFLFPVLVFVSLPFASQRADGLVLVAELEPEAEHLEFEAAPSNWNQALNDAGQGQFEGELFFDEEDGSGCERLLGGRHPPEMAGRILLVAAPPDRWSTGTGPFYEAILGEAGRGSARSDCEASFAELTTAASAGGAIAVVFVQRGDRLGGISLGDSEVPPIRAVMIASASGVALLDHLKTRPKLEVHLEQGRLIAQDAYEEQFIFRVDEIASTRAANFLWHTHPGMLKTAGGLTLSEKLFRQQIQLPEGWFSSTPAFIPLFNPSLVTLRDGTLLASLRMSNGPGCPSLRKMRESSMETRIFRNELLLAQLDPVDLSPISHTIVEMPPLTCNFSDVNVSGRKFLDEVSGPMDVRLRASDDGEETWILFYAERNAGGGEVMRGLNVAPLQLEFGECRQDEVAGTAAAAPEWGYVGPSGSTSRCSPRGHAVTAVSLEECQSSCDALQGGDGCDTITLGPRGECLFSFCSAKPTFAPASEAPARWQVWQRAAARESEAAQRVWEEGSFTCGWLSSSHQPTLEACRRHCEQQSDSDNERCDSIVFSEAQESCHLQSCQPGDKLEKREAPKGWSIWHLVPEDPPQKKSSPKAHHQRSCLQRAQVHEQEVMVFPATQGVEKNWNIISLGKDRMVLEYHVDPHIVLEASFWTSPSGSRHLLSMQELTITRWPWEVIHGVTNVRGGFCCMPFEISEGLGGIPAGRYLLGAGHLQRIRTPFDQASGDLNRFRRQASSRTYHQFFYLLRPEFPYDVMGVSTEFCVTMNGHFSNHWKTVLAESEEACEAIQFVAGLALKGEGQVVVGYGINDCEADLLEVSLEKILSMVRPVVSDLNVNLEELDMI